MNRGTVATLVMEFTLKLSAVARGLLPLAVPATLLCLPGYSLAGSIYKCTDPDGATTYTSEPCSEQQLTDVVGELPRNSEHQPQRQTERRKERRAERTGPAERYRPGIPDLGEAHERIAPDTLIPPEKLPSP